MCGQRGLCGCGRKVCEIAEWWINWGLLWRCLSYEFEVQWDRERHVRQLLGFE